jgi:hypothetical protein
MAEEFMIGIAAIWAALALGLIPAMTLFIGRIAFMTLDADNAAKFLRAAFQIYYLMLACFSGFAAALLALPRPIEAGMMALIAVMALYGRYWLLPIAHNLDDLRMQNRPPGQASGEGAAARTDIASEIANANHDDVEDLGEEARLEAMRTEELSIQRALIKVQSRSSFIAVIQIAFGITVVVRLAIV